MSQTLGLKKVILPGVCAALLLSGCGGSSSTTTVTRADPPEDTRSGNDDFSGKVVQDYFVGDNATLKAGVFLGTVTYEDGTSVDGLMFLSATGNYNFILDTDSNILNADIVSGTLSLDETAIDGSAAEYKLIDTWTRSPDSPNRAAISGSVTSTTTALLDSGGRVVQTEIIRDSVSSDQSLSLAQIAGIYETTGPDPQITIDVDGGINGVDRGCVLQGQITIPVADLNIYELSYEASGCTALPEATSAERNGEYLGVGTFIPAADSTGDDAIDFAASNGKIAFDFYSTR